MSISDFNLDLPFPDVFPESWAAKIGKVDFMMFRNLSHFKYEVSKLTQRDDNKCDVSYKKALSMLINNESDFPVVEQETIRNLVRSNLHKRGLITSELYEKFNYTSDGTQIDVDIGKYVSGEPDCVLSPSRQYIDFFYELFISISYPWSITNEEIRKNIAKLLATIEELEQKHIFIKITLVLPIKNVCRNRIKSNFFSSIPLFSHKDIKTVNTMSTVINDRLLRKFFFALIENEYKTNITDKYGIPVSLEGVMNIGEKFNEIDFFESVVKIVGA